MRRLVQVVVGGFLVAASVGCVSTNEVGGSNRATATTTTAAPEPGAFGADVEYGGVLATVVDVAAFDQSPNGIPRIKVVMRAENLTDSAQHNPDVQLLCDETTNAGDWFLGSTWEPNVVLPVNAVSQGEVIVGFPRKGDNPEYAVVTCTAPKLRLSIVSTRAPLPTDCSADSSIACEAPPRVVLIPIDDAVIEEAIRRPRGPALPLPPTGS